jgi:hypothetical protein
MRQLTKFQAIKLWALTAAILYLLASLLSLSVDMDEWNMLSKVLFYLPTILTGAWTIKDYFMD